MTGVRLFGSGRKASGHLRRIVRHGMPGIQDRPGKIGKVILHPDCFCCRFQSRQIQSCTRVTDVIKSFYAMRKEVMIMAGFVPKEKMSKKAQKELNRQRRVTWGFSPVTKTVESKKIYSRKKKAHVRDEYGMSFFRLLLFAGYRPIRRFRDQTRSSLVPGIPCASNSSAIART